MKSSSRLVGPRLVFKLARLTLACIVSLFLGFAFGGAVFAEQSATPANPQSKRPELPSFLRQNGVSLYVEQLPSSTDHAPKVLYNQQAQTPAKPASLMKILGSWLAHRSLGLDYRFVTKFSERASENGEGRALVVHVSGDPSLRSEELFLASQSIRSRLGAEVVFEELVLASERPAWAFERSGQRAYEAGFAQSALNFNALAFSICREGNQVKTVPAPALPRISLHGSIAASGGASFALDEVSPWSYRVSGSLSSGCRQVYRSVPDADAYFADTLRLFLEQQGIVIRSPGFRRVGSVAPGRVLFEHESRPLNFLLFDKNRYSSNFYSGQLARVIGERLPGDGDAAGKGHRAMGQALEQLGVPREQFRIVDASGLSHDNRLSAHAIVRVLNAFYRDFSAREDFLASLAVPGRLGTLESRDYGVFFRAKTGSLRDTRSLAGYVENQRGEMIAFALIQNGERLLADALLRERELLRLLHSLR